MSAKIITAIVLSLTSKVIKGHEIFYNFVKMFRDLRFIINIELGIVFNNDFFIDIHIILIFDLI